MAKTAALLIAALALPAVAAARGAESDPARRSLVVEAVEKASPAVVNVSTEQIVEQRRSPLPFPQEDRKSTRLNSSHGYISYAGFCLKKKKSDNAKHR